MSRSLAIGLLLLAIAAATGCGVAPPRPAVPAAEPLPEPPLLRLPPWALPGGLALQQRLTFRHAGRRDTVDALVEADARAVRVVMHVQGRVALSLVWDGETLQQTRADWLPPQVRAERVLGELQLVYWPAEAITAALPPGWSLLTVGREHRYLVQGPARTRVLGVDYAGDAATLTSLDPARDYELHIESTPVTP